MSLTSKLSSQFGRPLTVGVLSYLGAMAFLPQSSANIMNYSINSNLYYGILGVAGSFVSELGKNWILPMIPNNMPFYQTEVMLIAPLLNAGIFALGTKYMVGGSGSAVFAGGSSPGLLYPALLGAGAQIGGSYLYDAVWGPYVA